MSFPKILALFTFLLFAAIAFTGWWKSNTIQDKPVIQPGVPVEVIPQQTIRIAEPIKPVVQPIFVKPVKTEDPPEEDRIEELFHTTGKKLPIVETVTYKSQVNWNKGKKAWLSDYASHYHTSRHFIARSRNGKPDYIKQDLAEKDRFNVLRNDIKFQFNLVIDLSRSKMWLFYIDLESGQKEMIKAYPVGIGRTSPEAESGFLTPIGQYLLGDRTGTYKPGNFGIHNGAKVEMIRIFGTRWIPLAKEIGPSTLPARGLGIHGVPWKENEKGELIEDVSSIGKYQSDGCIRLSTQDVEELYAVIITKPCVVEIVHDFYDAEYPVAEAEPAVRAGGV